MPLPNSYIAKIWKFRARIAVALAGSTACYYFLNSLTVAVKLEPKSIKLLGISIKMPSMLVHVQMFGTTTSIAIATLFGAILLGIYASSAQFIAYLNSDIRPKGDAIDILLPPSDAEHRIEALDAAFNDIWQVKYSWRRAKFIYAVQVVIVIMMYWMDRLTSKTTAKK